MQVVTRFFPPPLALNLSDLTAALRGVEIFASATGAILAIGETKDKKRSARFDGTPIESWTVTLDGAVVIVDDSGSYSANGIDESNPLHIALYFAISGVCESAQARN